MYELLARRERKCSTQRVTLALGCGATCSFIHSHAHLYHRSRHSHAHLYHRSRLWDDVFIYTQPCPFIPFALGSGTTWDALTAASWSIARRGVSPHAASSGGACSIGQWRARGSHSACILPCACSQCTDGSVHCVWLWARSRQYQHIPNILYDTLPTTPTCVYVRLYATRPGAPARTLVTARGSPPGANATRTRTANGNA